ncbi:MAG TPA: LytTR family DNA-binding domain-containing protein [Sphaerochaeta sp.]|nr:LytTR family DNA-binding domain-containing protein [Sphaerochaeta sp.]
MIKIAICDDNKEELARMRTHCVAYSAKHPEYDVRVSSFEDSYILLSHIEKKNDFDVMILDIYMPNLSGIELARELRKKDDACALIFLTTSDNHAVEAFSLNATHYIVKPYTSEQFDVALDKAFAQREKRNKAKINLKSVSGVTTILFDDFLYSETEGHFQHIHLADGTNLRIRITSIELYEMLSHDGRFYKYGSSYIINLEKVKQITLDHIILETTTKLQMQRRQFKPLTDRYTQYSLSKER